MEIKLIVTLSLLLVMVACTQGSDTHEVGFSGDSQKVNQEQGPPCTREENKNIPGCKVVVVSYSGNISFGPLSLIGEVKNLFYPNGLLKSSSFYPQNRPDAAMLVHNFTYDNEDHVQIWEALSDTQPAVVGDGTLDSKNTLTNTWENDILKRVDGVTETVPPDPNVPNTIYWKDYIPNPDPNNPAAPYNYTYREFWETEGGAGVHTIGQETTVLNDDELPEEVVKYLEYNCAYQPAGTCSLGQSRKQAKLETLRNTYLNKRLLQSVWNKYDCPNGQSLARGWGKACLRPFSTVPPISTIETYDPQPPKYQELTSNFDYDGQDRVIRIDMHVDGNLDYPNPGPAVDGTENWHGWCTFEYDDTNPGVTIAKFPEPFKVLGIHDNDKITTITCEDDAGRYGGKLDIKWAYLHEIHPDVEGPSNP